MLAFTSAKRAFMSVRRSSIRAFVEQEPPMMASTTVAPLPMTVRRSAFVTIRAYYTEPGYRDG